MSPTLVSADKSNVESGNYYLTSNLLTLVSEDKSNVGK